MADMTAENKAWWKGTFPSWIVAGLLALVWFGIQRTLAEVDNIHAQVISTTTKVAILENEAKEFRDAIIETRKAQLDMLVELKQIVAAFKGRP